MKLKLSLGLLAFTLLVTACSDHTVKNTSEYTTWIAELEKEIYELKRYNQELAKNIAESDKEITTHPHIAQADLNSRKIMSYIANKDIDRLKEQFGAEIELNETEDEIVFTKATFKRSFPIKLFSGFSHLNGMIVNEERTKISYSIHDDVNEQKEIVSFTYDADFNFQFIE